MGVKQLWELLWPIGRRISVESLEGKRLAIDASIWLTQFLTVAQKILEKEQNYQDMDHEENNSSSFHGGATTIRSSSSSQHPVVHYLANTLKRLCKLRFQGIRPVLVFDGATPEIKMRELKERQQRRKRKRESFLLVAASTTTSTTDDGSNDDNNPEIKEMMQRVAKRILSQQLVKGANGKLMLIQSKNKKAGNEKEKQLLDDDHVSKIPTIQRTFYDPGMEERERKRKEKQRQGLEEQVVKSRKKAKLKEEEQELIQLLEEDDYLEQAAADGALQQVQNDWDIGIVSQTNNPEEENTKMEQKGDNATTSKTNPTRRGKKKKRPSDFVHYENFHSGDGTHLAVQEVAQLDANQRKAVIEDAKKQRYLASRSEYLEQASNPEALSQTQLRNFLKSTKLNQDIVLMAKQAAKLQEQHKAMRNEDRIIFEKYENNEDEDDDDDDGDSSLYLKRPRPTAKQRQAQREPKRTQSLSILQDTDDERDEKDIVHDTPQHINNHQSGDNYFRRRIIQDNDVDDENDDDNNDGEDDESSNDGPVKHHQPTSGGFFVPLTAKSNTESKLTKNPIVHTVPPQSSLSSSKKIQIQDDDDDDDDVKVNTVDDDNDDDDEGSDYDDGQRSAKHEDSFMQQQQLVQDEALARALQEMEDDEGREVLETENVGRDGIDNQKTIKNYGQGFLPDHSVTHGEIPERLPRSKISIAIRDSNFDNHDNCDRNEPAANVETTAVLRQQKLWETNDETIANSLQQAEYEVEPGCGGYDCDSLAIGGGFVPANASAGTGGAEDEIDVESEEEEESVDWQDGEDDERTHYTPAGQDSQEDTHSAIEIERRNSGQKIEDESHEYEAVDWEERDDDESNYRTDEVDNNAFQEDDWGTPVTDQAKTSLDLSAALEQAQKTAAGLTNWAGRAVRRAVADHAASKGLEVPESVKPSAIVSSGDNQTSPQLSKSVKHLETTNFESSAAHSNSKKASSPPKRPTNDSYDFLETVPTEADRMAQQLYGIANQSPTKTSTTEVPGGVTEEIRNEVMQLLQLFGIPYVVAPAEAEAQCVELERLGLVDGIVTDDCDAFVFGGRIVYKNLFKDQQYVEEYHAKDAQTELNLTRDAFVALAMLLGGDYTEGVKGVGRVIGMEILAAFNVAEDCKKGLTRFRKWLDGFDPSDLVSGSKDGQNTLGVAEEFHKQHRMARNRWIAPKHFPDDRVLNAYWHPVVDTSNERFSWGEPNLDGLILFCNQHLGWPAEQTKTLINPVLDRLQSSSMRQTRMDSFMTYDDGIKFATIRSKRLQAVLKATTKKSFKKEVNDSRSSTEPNG